MPQNEPYVYDVVIGGVEYEVSSPGPLTETQAYSFALKQSQAEQGSGGLSGPVMQAVPEKGFVAGFMDRAGETLTGLKALGQGMMTDPLGTLTGMMPEAPKATHALTSEEIRRRSLQAAERQGRAEAPFGERLGRAAEAGAEFIAPLGIGKMLKGTGGRAAAMAGRTPVAAGPTLAKTKTPTLDQTILEALEEARVAKDPVEGVSLGPGLDIPTPTASAAESRARQAVQGRPGGTRTRTFTEPPPPADGPRLGPTSPPEGLPGPQAGPSPGPSPVRHIGQEPVRVGPTVEEMRGAYGSDRTARYLNEMSGLREEIGMPVTKDMVQDISGGPSRVPTSVSNRTLDEEFARLIADERGGLTLGMLGDLGEAAGKGLMQLRGLSLLSGYAPLKSAVGNVGALATHGLETGKGLSPLWELTTGDFWGDVGKGWRRQANPSQNVTMGTGPVNVIGRGMGALDEATTKALMRQGASLEDAQRLLLTAPNDVFSWIRGMENPFARAAANYTFPFQRTPSNTLIEGYKSIGDLTGMEGGRKLALTGGALAAGEEMGRADASVPALGVASAFLGPRAGLFLMGAGAGRVLGEGNAQEVVGGLSPMSEFNFRSMFNPIDQFTFGPFRRAWGGEGRQ